MTLLGAVVVYAAVESLAPVVTSFEDFVAVEGSRLHRVLCARLGPDVGPEVTADALAYAWEHWARISEMENPGGYLYRVAQTSSRRYSWRRWFRPKPTAPEEVVEPEPELQAALRRLSPSQRTAITLVYALDWSQQDAARAMSISVSTLRNHLARGLAHLRRILDWEAMSMDVFDRLRAYGDAFERSAARTMPSAPRARSHPARGHVLRPAALAAAGLVAALMIAIVMSVRNAGTSQLSTGFDPGDSSATVLGVSSAATSSAPPRPGDSEAALLDLPHLAPAAVPEGSAEIRTERFDRRSGNDGWVQIYAPEAEPDGRIVLASQGSGMGVTLPAIAATIRAAGSGAANLAEITSATRLADDGASWIVDPLPSGYVLFAQGPYLPVGLMRMWRLGDGTELTMTVSYGLGSFADSRSVDSFRAIEGPDGDVWLERRTRSRGDVVLAANWANAAVVFVTAADESVARSVLASVGVVDDSVWQEIIDRSTSDGSPAGSPLPQRVGDPLAASLVGLTHYLPGALPYGMELSSPAAGTAGSSEAVKSRVPGANRAISLEWTAGLRSISVATLEGSLDQILTPGYGGDAEPIDVAGARGWIVDGIRVVSVAPDGQIVEVAGTGVSRADLLTVADSLRVVPSDEWLSVWREIP